MQPRCLIADDVRAARELLRTWVTEWECQATLASDGWAAWSSIQDACPDLIVMDIAMPGRNGLEILQLVRSSESAKIRQTPVLIVTGLFDSELSRVVRRRGANGLLIKPLEKTSTAEAVSSLLAPNRCWDRFVVNLPNDSGIGPGVISPTFRRFLDETTTKDRFVR